MVSELVGPVFEGVAKRKLNDLLERGWEISGYSIFKDGEHGLVTTGSFVGWWTVADQSLLKAEREIEGLKAALSDAVKALEEIATDTAHSDHWLQERARSFIRSRTTEGENG